MDRPARHFYEFDSFRVDVEERQLLQNGKPVQLTPKVFDILLALVENCGHTLGKDQLMQKVWADSFVEEGNLNRNVSTLRKVLGDDSHEPRFIKTAPKRGYRFVGEVREIWEEDEALLVENRTSYRLKVREEIVRDAATRRRGDAAKNLRVAASPRLRVGLLIGVLVLIAVAVAAFFWNRTPKNEARSLNSMKGTENAEVFELYRRGRALWQTRSGENLHQATVLLEQAVQKDANFALARAALADCYAFDYANRKKAEIEAREAIRLDPSLGEPHATIGFVKMFWEWNFKEAEDEFKQAVRLSPNYAAAHQWYSVLLSATDRHNAAYAEMRQALDLEPDSLSINADLCQTLYFMRRYDEAIAQCQKTLGMNDKFHNAHLYLYEIYNAGGMRREAFEQHFKSEETAGVKSSPETVEKLRTAYQTGGIRAFWRARIEAFKGGKSPEYYKIAQYYARLGEKEEALKWLREAYQARDFNFILLLADPTFDDFHGARRFNELMPFIAALEN